MTAWLAWSAIENVSVLELQSNQREWFVILQWSNLKVCIWKWIKQIWLLSPKIVAIWFDQFQLFDLIQKCWIKIEVQIIEQHILDTNAGKQLSSAATDV